MFLQRDSQATNDRIGSAKADRLKFAKSICTNCNNALTQPCAPPEHCPAHVKAVFSEGAKCFAVECFNAAGTMFRLCVDLATRKMLPSDDMEGGPNAKQRRDLGLRLPWLMEQGLLPKELQELSHCIKEDGNDGAHAGTLKREDAEDLLDFTAALLERVYTEPERLGLAKQRRDQRRKAAPPPMRALPSPRAR